MNCKKCKFLDNCSKNDSLNTVNCGKFEPIPTTNVVDYGESHIYNLLAAFIKSVEE